MKEEFDILNKRLDSLQESVNDISQEEVQVRFDGTDLCWCVFFICATLIIIFA